MNTQSREPFCLYQKYVSDFEKGDHPVCKYKLLEFCQELEALGLLLSQFDWTYWYSSCHLVDKPDYILDATYKECQFLLTAMVRLERFSPGVLENMRRQGVLLAIIERLQALTLKHAI